MSLRPRVLLLLLCAALCLSNAAAISANESKDGPRWIWSASPAKGDAFLRKTVVLAA